MPVPDHQIRRAAIEKVKSIGSLPSPPPISGCLQAVKSAKTASRQPPRPNRLRSDRLLSYIYLVVAWFCLARPDGSKIEVAVSVKLRACVASLRPLARFLASKRRFRSRSSTARGKAKAPRAHLGFAPVGGGTETPRLGAARSRQEKASTHTVAATPQRARRAHP